MASASATTFNPLAWAADAGGLLFLIWSIPAGILLLGLPVVVAVRLALEIFERLF